MGKTKTPIKAAILASGQGTNAERIVKFSREDRMSLRPIISCLITDNPKSPVLDFPVKFQSPPCYLIPYRPGEKRRDHEQRILEKLQEHNVEWVFLAGHRRILSEYFLQAFYDQERDVCRILNIHPSLLPDLPGLRAYERAFYANREYSGVTVHFVDSGVDTGKIICQERFLRDAKDSLEDFIGRGKRLEHKLYPKAIEMVLNGEKP